MYSKHISAAFPQYFSKNYSRAALNMYTNIVSSKLVNPVMIHTVQQKNLANGKMPFLLPKTNLSILKTPMGSDTSNTCKPTPPTSTTTPPTSTTTPQAESSAGSASSSSNKFTINRQEPGPVRLGFIPDEWYMAFYKKTGGTGLGTFFFTIMITLMSKEYYILEHEYYGGLSMAILCVLGVKYVGPIISKFIDEEIDEYEKGWTAGRDKQRTDLEKLIEKENKNQLSMEGQLILLEAKRENVALQLEAAYRQRLMYAYQETRKRLEFCVSREAAEKALARRMMGIWVTEQVKASINKEIEDQSLNKCLEDLKLLAKNYEGFLGPYQPEDPPHGVDKDPKKSKK